MTRRDIGFGFTGGGNLVPTTGKTPERMEIRTRQPVYRTGTELRLVTVEMRT